MESLNKEFFVHSKKNLGKKIWIQDLFRVAKDEEKFRRGELGKSKVSLYMKVYLHA